METKGVPLDLMIMELKDKNYIIDWIEFIDTSLNHNWKINNTLTRIENVLIDIYDKKYSKEIMDKLNLIYLSSNKES